LAFLDPRAIPEDSLLIQATGCFGVLVVITELPVGIVMYSKAKALPV